MKTLDRKIGGVYRIVNTINGKFYIGGSNNVRNRWNTHKAKLKSNTHENIHLQNSANKYGIDTLNFVLEKELPSSDPDLILEEEQKLLDKWYGTENCYNVNDRVDKLYGVHNPMFGRRHSHVSLEKMSQNRKGKLPFYEHPMFNPTIYTFRNVKTNDIFTGTCHDFCEKYNLHKGNIIQMVRKNPRMKTVKKWEVVYASICQG